MELPVCLDDLEVQIGHFQLFGKVCLTVVCIPQEPCLADWCSLHPED